MTVIDIMEEKKKIEIRFTGDRQQEIESLPEPLRSLIKEKLKAASAENPAGPGEKTITIRKDLDLSVGPGFLSLLNWMVKISLKPAPPLSGRPGAGTPPPNSGITAPSARPPQPAAIKPASSAHVIWIAAIILAVSYLLLWKR